jgi:SAM-dependent methyltransferase
MLEDLATLGSGLEYDLSIKMVRSRHSSWISFPPDGNVEYAKVEADSFWYRHRNECILAVMKQFPPNTPLFDIGGGNGFVTRYLEENGTPSVLVEPGPAGIATAKDRGVEKLIQSTLHDAEFSADVMPGAGAFDVVEHQEDDVGFLREIHHALVPGARLYLTVPAYSWLWSQTDVNGGHFRRYTLSRLRTILPTAGFSVEFATYIFSLLPLPIWWTRTLPYWRQRRLGGTTAAERFDPHTADRRGLGRLVNRILRLELRRLSRGKSIPFGGSCMVVATAH